MSGTAYRLSVRPTSYTQPFADDAAVYALEPVLLHADGVSSHVVVARPPHGVQVTDVLPCSAEGEVVWQPINGSQYGRLSDAQVLRCLGYEVVANEHA
ncbi:hypothetical protein [Nocardia sp. NPDC051463]|uniref:hypothetical protein n=1 Tax=Nocardia sp. NPDC051463 TaxID=3154845 RepID=UPI00344B088B